MTDFYMRPLDMKNGAVDLTHGAAAAPPRSSLTTSSDGTSRTPGSTKGTTARSFRP